MFVRWSEAKLRKRQAGESLRDFGQALEDLYRRAYPETPDIVEENAIKAFLDKCLQTVHTYQEKL
jgi:hypothetical protein